MPFIGLSPFLPNTDNAKEDLLNRVNALYRAFSISTDPETDSRNGKECVNALYRAFSISTMKCVNILEKEECVNALYRAFSISTLLLTRHHIRWHSCVNALYRAFSISTLPSGNALKWSICRLDFAGNCLTTSKSAYFLLFLCLFTLCSYFFVIFRP